LETAVTKLQKAILEEQNRFPKWSKDSHFSNRLADVAMKHKLLAESNKLDSIKEAIGHFNAAEAEHENMSLVASHVKSAVSSLKSFVNENQSRRSLQEEKDGAATAALTGAEFRQSVQCVAQAAIDKDRVKFALCAEAVKLGVQTAINKIDDILAAMPSEKLEELAQRWNEARDSSAIAAATADATQDPGAIASAVTKAIEGILSQPAGGIFPDQKDFQQLLWMVPVSVVWGGFLWLFIGLWTYGPEYGFLGSLWFEVSWILSGLGCMMDNQIACGVWNP
jgi:hypothetical protein